MQRLSNMLLTVSLAVFVSAASVALLTATWLMISSIVHGFAPMANPFEH